MIAFVDGDTTINTIIYNQLFYLNIAQLTHYTGAAYSGVKSLKQTIPTVKFNNLCYGDIRFCTRLLYLPSNPERAAHVFSWLNNLITKDNTSNDIENPENTININKDAFAVICNRCGSNTVKRAPRRRPDPITTHTKTTFKQRNHVKNWVETFKKLLELSNQSLVTVLTIYLTIINPSILFTIIQSFCSRHKDNIARVQSLCTGQITMNCDVFIYMKDRILLSDRAYFFLYRMVDAIGFPNLTALSNRKQSIFDEIENYFTIDEEIVDKIVVSVSCCFLVVIKAILAIELKLHGVLPSEVYLVFSGDGQRGRLRGNDGTNIFTIKTVGLKEFDSQCRRSVFPTVLWRGCESLGRGYLETTIKDLVSLRVLNYLVSVTCSNKEASTTIKPVWCTDLCFLDSIVDGGLYSDTDLFCPYCVCTKSKANKFGKIRNKRDLHVHGERINFIVCNLHCKQAITRNLLLLSSRGDRELMDIIEKEIDKLKGLKGFHFVTKEGSSSVDIDDEQEVVDNGSYRCPPLTGEQCTMILKSTSTIFNDDRYFDRLLSNIWLLWATICFDYLEGTTEHLSKRHDESLEQLLKKLGECISQRWPQQGVGWYLHILIHHLPTLIEEYKSLCPFSTQVLESHHQLMNNCYTRGTNHEGGRSGHDILTQLFSFSLRQVWVVLNNVNLCWNLPRQRRKRCDRIDNSQRSDQLYQSIVQMEEFQAFQEEGTLENYCPPSIDQQVMPVQIILGEESSERSQIEESSNMLIEEDIFTSSELSQEEEQYEGLVLSEEENYSQSNEALEDVNIEDELDSLFVYDSSFNTPTMMSLWELTEDENTNQHSYRYKPY